MNTSLQRIRSAAERIANGPGSYDFSCTALRHAGLSSAFATAYWRGLLDGPSTETVETVLVRDLEAPNSYWVLARNSETRLRADQRCREVRLMMLAWLHEMVRSGDFEAITGYSP